MGLFDFYPIQKISVSLEAQEHDWVTYLQALGPVIIGVVIAGISFYWAWRQSKMARLRLKESLYDRQFAVYKAASDFIRYGLHPDEEKHPFLETENNLIQAWHHAIFLFADSSIAEFMQSLRNPNTRLRDLRSQIEELEKYKKEGRDPRTEGLLGERNEEIRDLMANTHEEWKKLDLLFKPHLKFPEKI